MIASMLGSGWKNLVVLNFSVPLYRANTAQGRSNNNVRDVRQLWAVVGKTW